MTIVHRPHLRNRRRGFTLVELMVVCSVIGLLASLTLPAIQSVIASAHAVECQNNFNNLGASYNEFIRRRSTKPYTTPGTWCADLADEGRLSFALKCPVSSPEQGISTGTPSLRVTHGGWPLQSIPFEPGRRCLKKNETSKSYELWFEDWNNWDYADFHALVEPSPAGQKITVTLVDSSSTFDVLSSSGSVLLANVTKDNWRGRTCETSAIGSSYGINGRCDHFRSGEGRKILLIDYPKTIADVVGADAREQFSQVVAARHQGMCNVLFTDGSVAAFEPQVIDPANLTIHDNLWKPDRDTPLSPGK